MRKKGYNFKELAKFLADKGVPIAAPTLATYMRSHRLKKAGEPPTKRSRTKGDTA